MSVEEEIRSDFSPVKAGAPLPWLLLAITLIVGVTMAIVSHARLVDEKVKTARALQANDEVIGRLKSVIAENTRLLEQSDSFRNQKQELEARQKSMEDQLRSSADEIAKYKSNPRCR